MCDSPLRTISPECVLQTSLSQSSYTTTPVEYVITPTKYRNKRKQSTPQRSPFSNITNISPRKRQTKLMKTESKFSKKCPGKLLCCNLVTYTKGFSRKKYPVGSERHRFFFYLGGGHKTYFFSGGCCQISI